MISIPDKHHKFRSLTKWKVKNRILMGLLLVNDVPLSLLAEYIGVTHRSVSHWIYDGTIPKNKNKSKVESLFDTPTNIIFNESYFKEIDYTYNSDQNFSIYNDHEISNKLLTGLLILYNFNFRKTMTFFDINRKNLYKLIYLNFNIDQDKMNDIAKYFSIQKNILFNSYGDFKPKVSSKKIIKN